MKRKESLFSGFVVGILAFVLGVFFGDGEMWVPTPYSLVGILVTAVLAAVSSEILARRFKGSKIGWWFLSFNLSEGTIFVLSLASVLFVLQLVRFILTTAS